MLVFRNAAPCGLQVGTNMDLFSAMNTLYGAVYWVGNILLRKNTSNKNSLT
jgi:hypothetical protein